MISPRPHRASRRSRLLCPSFSQLLACGVAAVSLWSVSQIGATPYYWDDNGATAGTSAAPTGTLGTDTFLSTSSTGTAATTVATPTAADTLLFVAGASTAATTSSGSSAFTVSISGTTQELLGLTFQEAGVLTLGASAGAGTINLGANGLTSVRYTSGTTNVAPVIVNANLVLTANQTWTAGNVNVGNTAAAVTYAGTTTGTGNLTVATTNSGNFLVTGTLNNTGTLALNTSSSGGVGVSGLIGANVTGLTIASTGNGVVTLARSAGNSYTGTTNLTSGTLRLSNSNTNSATGTSTVNITGANALLIGNGRSTGLLTVTSGGQISPSGGTGINAGGVVSQSSTDTGTLSLGVTGGMNLSQATLSFNLSSTAAGTNDQIVTGALTLGTLTINLSPSGMNTTNTGAIADTGTAYKLIDTNGTTNGFDLNNIQTNISGFSQGYTATYSLGTGTNAGDLFVAFAPVPEPSTTVGASMLLGMLGWMQLRRLRRARA